MKIVIVILTGILTVMNVLMMILLTTMMTVMKSIPRTLHPPSRFQGTVGWTLDMSNKAPVDFFHLMVTDQMLEEVVQQTNLYAQQFMEATNLPPKSRAHLWDQTPHDLAELKKFLSLVIVMGLMHFPAIEDYWVTTWPFANNTFSSVIKRDRFTLLLHPPK